MESSNSQSVRFADIVRQLLDQFNREKPDAIHVIRLSKQIQIEKRRLYDLFNILTALKVCNRMDNAGHGFRWNTLDVIPDAIKDIFIETEMQIMEKGFKSLFPLGASPSLGSLTKALLSVFFYTGLTKVNVKLMAILFAEKSIRFKQMLRRLYLVAFFLEQLDIMKRTAAIGEYEILFDLKQYTIDAYEKMKKMNTFPYTSIENYLSKIDTAYIQSTQQVRQKEMLSLAETTNHHFFVNISPNRNKDSEEFCEYSPSSEIELP